MIVDGCGRKTTDLDLLVREDDRRAWVTGRIRSLASFICTILSAVRCRRLDLMLADSGTFSKLSTAPHSGVLENQPVVVPALPHLLGLKLHALRHGHPDRQVRDFGDVVELVRRHKVNLPRPNIRRYWTGMPTTSHGESSPKLARDLFDLNLPVSDVPWPVRHEMSPNDVYALNAEIWKTQVLDDAYWAESLAAKKSRAICNIAGSAGYFFNRSGLSSSKALIWPKIGA